MEKIFLIPEYTTAQEIRGVRKTLGLTQEEFGRMIGCSKPTIVRWEKSEENITGPIAGIIYLLNHNVTKEDVILPQMKYRLRLIYMYKQRICTIIDVDENNQKVETKDFEDNIMYRAFGVNGHPSYEEYEEFLKSRCFPETRDKMKLILKDLNLPFYDPMMIIEKTEGRMAEDDFWIKVVRK